MNSSRRAMLFSMFVLFIVCCSSTLRAADAKEAPADKKPTDSGLKYESVVLKDAPGATIHVLYRPGKLQRRPVILMLGSLTPDHPPEWSRGLLDDGYMLAAFLVDYPLDPDPTRRSRWLAFDEGFAHGYVLGGHRYAVDTQRVIDYLAKRGDVDVNKIGWMGASSTGILGLGVATQGPRLAAMVLFVSTGAYEQWLQSWHTNGLWRGKTNDLWPETKELLKYDPIRHVQRLYPTAVLMVSGGEDKIVDPATARAFVKAATPYYEQDPDRLRLVVYENYSHNLPADVVKLHAEHWFRLYMSPNSPPPKSAVRPKTLSESANKTSINAADHKSVMGEGKK